MRHAQGGRAEGLEQDATKRELPEMLATMAEQPLSCLRAGSSWLQARLQTLPAYTGCTITHEIWGNEQSLLGSQSGAHWNGLC
jgi:hypothetical protein